MRVLAVKLQRFGARVDEPRPLHAGHPLPPERRAGAKPLHRRFLLRRVRPPRVALPRKEVRACFGRRPLPRPLKQPPRFRGLVRRQRHNRASPRRRWRPSSATHPAPWHLEAPHDDSGASAGAAPRICGRSSQRPSAAAWTAESWRRSRRERVCSSAAATRSSLTRSYSSSCGACAGPGFSHTTAGTYAHASSPAYVPPLPPAPDAHISPALSWVSTQARRWRASSVWPMIGGQRAWRTRKVSGGCGGGGGGCGGGGGGGGKEEH